jgi:aspartate aminotransferase-like enzyme
MSSFLVAGCRTPIGKLCGALSSWTAPQLGAAVVRDTLRRAGLAPEQVDEVVMGDVLQAGLGQAPARPAVAAHTLSAPYFPEGVDGAALLAKINAAGVVLAGGLHPAIRARYFRIGHMGAVSGADILAAVSAIEQGLRDVGYQFDAGSGLAAAQRVIEG